MEALKRKLWKEIDEIADKPELGAGDLELLHKLTDTVKNIDKICMLEDGGYANDGYSNRHYVRAHYSRDGGQYDGNGRSYDRGGQYDGGGYSGRRRDSRGRYSRDGGRDAMLDHLSEAMAAGSDDDKEQIRRLMDKLEQM